MLLAFFLQTGVWAQTIPKPSVPEFTLKYADHSYDVPPTSTSSFNPYNNQTTTTTEPGYHVENLTIDITIRNQPIPSTIDGNKSYLLFEIRYKGHYGNGTDWTYPFGTFYSCPTQSDSDYTVISLATSYNYGVNTESPLLDLQNGDKIDFQIMAILAYGYNYSMSAVVPLYSYDYESVATSDWSSTQTITIGEPTVTSDVGRTSTPTSTDTPTPTLEPSLAPFSVNFPASQSTLFAVGIGVAAALAVAAVALALRRRTSRENASSKPLPPPPQP